MRFRNNIALISGAGSGIGRATAQIIGAEGGTVVGVDVNGEALEQIMSGVRRAGGQARGAVPLFRGPTPRWTNSHWTTGSGC
jgi:NAD(P)-dependent dehydrogenase (short-subunit alcohol dehydrogenase family)